MKIEFEIDEKRIEAEVINRMVQMLWPAIDSEVKLAVRQIVQAELGARTRALTAHVLAVELMPGTDKTLTEFIRGVLNRTEQNYRDRTRITHIIEETAFREAIHIFQEELRQHAETFRQKLVEHILVAVSKG